MKASRGVRIQVHGRVQGVFYRANARTTATRLGLRGWVRNLPDGTVEAVAAGPPAAVEEFITWCRQGPPAARVDRIVVDDWPNEASLPATFEVRF